MSYEDEVEIAAKLKIVELEFAKRGIPENKNDWSHIKDPLLTRCIQVLQSFPEHELREFRICPDFRLLLFFDFLGCSSKL